MSTEHLHKIVAEIANDLPITVEIREGIPAKQIVEIADEYKADYIYLGKHNHPTFEKVLVGETSRSVIQNSLVPVILIEQVKTDKVCR